MQCDRVFFSLVFLALVFLSLLSSSSPSSSLLLSRYVEPLLRNIRAQVLMELVKPYQRIKIDFISRVSVRECS